MNRRDPRIALIGAGYWGRNLLRNFEALGVLAVACDENPQARASLAAAFPSVVWSDGVTAILDRDDIDAVAIATPAATHGALVRRALEAGKHVFVEKPLCLDLDEARALEALAQERGRILMVGHLLQYHPAFEALRAAVADGGLGTLRYIYSNRLSLGKIRREENALWSFAPHDISMILRLAGDRLPGEVTATGANFLHSSVADTTLSHLLFEGGLQAHIFVSWLHPYKDQRLVVIGETGMAVFNDVLSGPDKLLLYPHKASWDGDLPVVDKAEGKPIPYGAAEPLRRECECFVDAVRDGVPPPTDAAEAIRVLRVLDACQRAIHAGAKVVL